MSEFDSYVNQIPLEIKGKNNFVLRQTNEFIISQLINEISISTDKPIYYVTRDSKECTLLIEYIEDVWNKKTYYLDNIFLNSKESQLNERDKLLDKLHFLQKNNNEIRFIELNNLYSSFNEDLRKEKLLLEIDNIKLNREKLINKLESFEYKKNDFIEKLGEYSVRGSIVDIFTPTYKSPIRIEFLKDKIHSMNNFNIENERRENNNFYKIEILSLKSKVKKKNSTLIDYIEDSIIFTDLSADSFLKNKKFKKFNKRNKIIQTNPIGMIESASQFEFNVKNIEERLSGSVTDLSKFIEKQERNSKITIVSDSNTIDNLKVDLPKKENLFFLKGFLRKSFQVLNFNEFFLSFNPSNNNRNLNINSKKYANSSFKLSGFNDLKPNDLIIHKDYGLCSFNGIKNKVIGAKKVDFIECMFEHNDLLLIPIDRISLIQKYIGPKEKKKLDSLRTKIWSGKVKRAKKVAETTAREILSLYAQRKSIKGFNFKINNEEIEDFENTFEYEETIDQKNAIMDTYNDMQKSLPMDRLICGDVGFGKTEIALRAAFLSSMNMKQTAIITPTTLLAHQHLKTFKKRLAKFPLRVEGVTRFSKQKELDNIIHDLENGKIDILIGTHKIFSKKIKIKNLGLIIVDEEHKFGVSDKEKIKQLKKGIDSLSISATPIPRTLQLSLSGLREISLLATPPKERLSIETHIEKFDNLLIKEAIEYEINRKGKTFFIHNEIKSIENLYKNIKKIMPKIRVNFIHGKMKGDVTEKVLKDFIDGNLDVLITTTIIEAGLDIQDANTIIINDAHKFGLSDLYQLRGRIGRGNKKGKAYLLIPNTEITNNAKKRLDAIRNLTKLGSGFNIAMEDLEIRGAGNLFGTQQSGNIYDVGIEFYLELLEKEVRKINKQTIDETSEVEIIYKENTFIPKYYIESAERRLFYYKKISLVSDKKDYADLIEELLDKFGPIPKELQNLMNISLIKVECQRIGIHKMAIERKKIVMHSKKIKEMKKIEIEMNGLNTEPKEVIRYLKNVKDIKEILKSHYEIIDGRFIINNN